MSRTRSQRPGQALAGGSALPWPSSASPGPGSSDGLCCRLGKPCQTQKPQKPWWQDEWEVPRESLKLVEKLGAGQFGEVWMGESGWNRGTTVSSRILQLGRIQLGSHTEQPAQPKVWHCAFEGPGRRQKPAQTFFSPIPGSLLCWWTERGHVGSQSCWLCPHLGVSLVAGMLEQLGGLGGRSSTKTPPAP